MAGGKGTRLNPFTNILPKPLFPLDGKPIILKIIEQFNNWGFKNFIYQSMISPKLLELFF